DCSSHEMAVDGDSRDWDGRWNHVKKFLERPGPFTHPDFEPSIEALSGFHHIHVVDMDTIGDINLNRQFLFRFDVGRPKADMAADFVNGQFHIIVCGLDSIIARCWMNGMLISLLSYEYCVLDPSSIIPLIDGGTEGFKGNARVILPGMTACIDCILELYPPQIHFPMCTIVSMPQLPEHCVEYVRMLQWPKDKPFGDGVGLDGDNPEHIHWVFQRAQERAVDYSITGVTYRLTQDDKTHCNIFHRLCCFVAACSTEVFKIASSTYIPLNNYLVFNIENCSACSQVPQDLQFPPSAKLQEVLEYLTENASLQMKSPAITATLDRKNKTLYLQTIASIEERTRPNLCKTLKELGLSDGQELAVADVTTPQTVLFKLKVTS
uniref:NEDD8-activating enzyme E1 catalytic subunit n=1 Tax=Oncorhynchus mykiss TaxID=8022 RepID=A0A8C7U2D4_ONCMY